LMKFMLGVDDVSGTNAERRVREVLAKGKEATKTYKLKSTSGKFKKNDHRFTPVQHERVGKRLKEMLTFFGYAYNKIDPDTQTDSFDFKGAYPELDKTYKGFVKQNEQMLAWAAELTEEVQRTI
jgi:hypothetical protein